MERSASNDDTVTCPLCEQRDALTVKWLPDIERRVHERTEVGCSRCEKWFSGKEDRWAYARWNAFAVEEWRKKGISIPHSELYELLKTESEAQELAAAQNDRVDQYLKDRIVPTCPFRVGDRFNARVRPGGKWSVRGIRAVYGTNTGPFWIIDACEVLPSGILGEERKEFWQRDAAGLELVPPYWQASRWSQVVVGDDCTLAGERGTVETVDTDRRTAGIRISGDLKRISSLSGLAVPLSRVEGNGT